MTSILAWQQKAVIACDRQGKTPAYASEFSGLSITQTYELRRRLGIQSKRRKYYAEDIARIFEAKSQGLMWCEIAKELSTTTRNLESVVARARRFGFDAFPKRSMP